MNSSTRVAAILALTLAVAGVARSAGQPNIIFFLVDDYDKPEASVYGGKVLTPNLDRMAREGMVFHNAHMTSTVCTPSRYTCLTGRYAGSSHFPGYIRECPLGQQGLPAFNVALEDDRMNVGRVLAENGYATGFVGKYHVGGEESHSPEELKKHGLHDVPKNVPWTEEINRKQFENEKIHRKMIKAQGFTWAKHIYWGNTKAPFKGHNPEWTAAAALEFIEEHKDGPFYLHYCTTLLHGPNGEWHKSLVEKPLVTNEGYLKEPIGLIDRKSVMERITAAGLTENEAGYLFMDDSLGLLLDKLDELGIADNTIVVFIADHGSERKGSLYKHRGTEVPCIVRWPLGVKPGVACHELVQNTDFVPTWFELAAAKVPKGYKIDGVSLAALFADPEKPVRDYVYGEMGPSRSIRTKQWSYMALRYIRQQIEGVRAGEKRVIKRLQGIGGGVSRGKENPNGFQCDQLYNLSRDPLEQKNLADNPEYGAKLAELKGTLTRELKRFPNRPYGEFVPGGNACRAGTYDDVLKRVASEVVEPPKRAKKEGASRRQKR